MILTRNPSDVVLDPSQTLYTLCSVCEVATENFGDGLCPAHRRELECVVKYSIMCVSVENIKERAAVEAEQALLGPLTVNVDPFEASSAASSSADTQKDETILRVSCFSSFFGL